MIVATRAIDRQAQQTLANHPDQILHFILLLHFLHPLGGTRDFVFHTRHEEPRGRPPIQRPGLQHVSSNLHPDEFVVGQILIQRANHPIAIGPRGVARSVVFVAIALTETHHVQPVTRPALAILGRIEHLIHEARPGLRRGITDKGGDVLRRGRQAGQVYVKPAKQSAGLGAWRWVQAVGGEFRQHKTVNSIKRLQ